MIGNNNAARAVVDGITNANKKLTNINDKSAPFAVLPNLDKRGSAEVVEKLGKLLKEEGIDAYFSIVNSSMTIEEAMDKENATNNMISTTTQIFNLIKAVK